MDLEQFLPEELQHWTPQQLEIMQARLQGLTYMQIVDKYGFSSSQAVTNFLRKTLEGNIIDLSITDQGGRPPLLPDIPALIFLREASIRADEMNCLKSNQAFHLIEEILAEYYFHSYKLCSTLRCPYLAAKILTKLEEIEFSSSWLTHFCKSHGFTLTNPQNLDLVRNKYCHSNVIEQFFGMLSYYIQNISPYLLFNADETSISYNKKGKVIVPPGKKPVSQDTILPGHYTLMASFNAVGDRIEPFIIVPTLKNLPAELYDFKHKAFFASSPSGWMTAKLFLAWALFFSHRVTAYRRSIAHLLGNQCDNPVFLLLDGHKSRANSEAIEVLHAHNIHVIVFPAHTTHILQPFDVSVAAPFKAYLKKFNETIPQTLRNKTQGYSPSQCKRYYLVHALLDAYQASTTSRNIQSGFEKCGLFPLDKQKPLSNPLLRRSSPNEPPLPEPRGVAINGMLITTPQKRLELYHYHNGNPTTNIPVPDKNQIIAFLRQGNEIILQNIPEIPLLFPNIPNLVYYARF